MKVLMFQVLLLHGISIGVSTSTQPLIVCDNFTHNVGPSVNKTSCSVSSVTEECQKALPSSFKIPGKIEPGQVDLRVEESGGIFNLSWLLEDPNGLENLQYIIELYVEESNVVPYLLNNCQSLYVHTTNKERQCRLTQACTYNGASGTIKITAIILSINRPWYTQLQFLSPGTFQRSTSPSTSTQSFSTSVTMTEVMVTAIPEEESDVTNIHTKVIAGVIVGTVLAVAVITGLMFYIRSKKVYCKRKPITESSVSNDNLNNNNLEHQQYRLATTTHQSYPSTVNNQQLRVPNHFCNTDTGQLPNMDNRAGRLPSFMQREIMNINRSTDESFEFYPPSEDLFI